MSYLLMVQWGKGPRYIQGRPVDGLLKANELAIATAFHLNSRKGKRAPKATVTVLRKVSEY